MTAGKVWTCTIIWNNQTLLSRNCLMQNMQAAFMSVIKSLPSWGQKHSWENCFPQNRGMRRAYPLGFTVISSNITDSFTSHALEKTHRLRTTGLWNYPWAVKYFWGKKWGINLHLLFHFLMKSIPMCFAIKPVNLSERAVVGLCTHAYKCLWLLYPI